MTDRRGFLYAAIAFLLLALGVAALFGQNFGGGGASSVGFSLGSRALHLSSRTIARLPTCGSRNSGQIAFVTDAQDTTDASIGGGTTMSVLYCSGSESGWTAAQVGER